MPVFALKEEHIPWEDEYCLMKTSAKKLQNIKAENGFNKFNKRNTYTVWRENYFWLAKIISLGARIGLSSVVTLRRMYAF